MAVLSVPNTVVSLVFLSYFFYFMKNQLQIFCHFI